MSDDDDNHLIAERRPSWRACASAAWRFQTISAATPWQRSGAGVRRQVARGARGRGGSGQRRWPSAPQECHGQGQFREDRRRQRGIQVRLERDTLHDVYEDFKTWDIGDVIGVEASCS